MRDIATILPTDLRSVSSAGNDILDFSVNSIQFRAFVGTSIVCQFVSAADSAVELPPIRLASGTILTAWITVPAPGDQAFVYNDSTEAGNADDSWVRL